MINQWKKDKTMFIKETDNEFKVVSCLTFVGIENNDYIYLPAVHTVNKSYYSVDTINEIVNRAFGSKADDMTLSEKIVYLSTLIGSCEDLEGGIQIAFKDNREASSIELEEKILSLIAELNL